MPPRAQYRLAITGASGFLGQQLVPRLVEAGCEVLLIGRAPGSLRALFPDLAISDYAGWTEQAAGFDAILNLAVVNNDEDQSWQAFQAVNAELPKELAIQAKTLGIPHFLQISSIHALDDANGTPYARSKRLAQDQLQSIADLHLTTLYLPLVWGDRWSSTLSLLNRLPRRLALALFRPLAALKPTVHVDRIADTILCALDNPRPEAVVADDADQNAWYRVGSAVMDYGFAISVLILFWWVLLLIGLSVRLTSPGPGIFAQTRVGKNGEPFTCYKFRTMKSGTAQAGTHEVSAASITPIGAFLRRTKLDELPQVFNILKGEVRLIGPRPGLPVQRQLFKARQTAGVFAMKPGISGWAQINEVDMSTPEKLALWDARYRGMRSLLFDLRIILATAFGRGQGDRVKADASL